MENIIVPIIIAIFGSTGFWAWLQSKTNKSKEILKKLDSISEGQKELDTKVHNLDNKVSENEAKNARNRIVRFADEIRAGLQHSKDMYDQILIDIDDYEYYCLNHPGFKNSVAEVSIKKTRQHYEEEDFI